MKAQWLEWLAGIREMLNRREKQAIDHVDRTPPCGGSGITRNDLPTLWPWPKPPADEIPVPMDARPGRIEVPANWTPEDVKVYREYFDTLLLKEKYPMGEVLPTQPRKFRGMCPECGEMSEETFPTEKQATDWEKEHKKVCRVLHPPKTEEE